MIREVLGLAALFWALFLAVSLFSHSGADPSLNQAVAGARTIHNMAGVAGAYASGAMYDFFGHGAWFWPLFFIHYGLSRFVADLRLCWWRWCGVFVLYLCFLIWACHPWLVSGDGAGGFMGQAMANLSLRILGRGGSFILWLFFSLLGLQLTIGISWATVCKRFRSLCYDLWAKYLERMERRRRVRKQQVEKAREEVQDIDFSLSGDSDKPTGGNPGSGKDKKETKPAKPSKPAKKAKPGENAPPPVDYLSPPDTRNQQDPKALGVQAQSLVDCLADFKIDGEMQAIIPGPVVTMFELRPAPGIKVSRIAGLSDDIALALKAMAVRIEAPIPGRDTVGIEIPNPDRQTVYLRTVIESDQFTKAASPLTLALGEDIQGEPNVADLAKMPHLLVAGATGAGKSVCINSMLMSFLYKATPDNLKLLLVDPKRIELSVYADLPHLVHPVVTDMALAKSALEWAVHEMDIRYESMARLGVRNIAGYNEKLEKKKGKLPEDLEDLKPMPYLVIIIDELADLMMTQGKDVEMSIVRLAQLARAAGIHIILATQRPSVDVVTGLIKANFPTRISFQVTSKHDSRTILDTVGAEKLLGRGDMLFKPGGGKLTRLHGAFVDEDEITRVVDHWKEQVPQEFELDFAQWQASPSGGEGGPGGPGASSDDPVYNEAVEFVMGQGKASISMIQRRFRIGFNRAARYIEQMEQDGILGPADGTKPRVVLGRD